MISWIGGKSKISKWIIPFIPNNIETYVEPFSGSMWVYFKMNLNIYKNLNDIVYNDYNDYLVNLFICCKKHNEFYNFIKDCKSQDEKLFYQYQNDLFKNKEEYNMPNFENAMKFAYLTTQVWSGISPSNGKFINLNGKYKSKFDSFKEKLKNDNYTNKLDKITNIENLDFEKCIEKYDNKNTFHYIDAPYFSTEHYYSNHDFNKKDHERLANVLKNITGKFAMSYYYFDDLEKWFSKDKYHWESKEFSKNSMAQSGKKQNKGTELLIMNY